MSLDLSLYTNVDLGGKEPYRVDVAQYNITHNLGKMAEDANLYKWLWRGNENGITLAGHLIAPLEAGLGVLRADPERFKALNSSNGWGNYGNLVTFTTLVLTACKAHPLAKVGFCI